MSLLVPINGQNYIIPETNEVGWGSNLDDFFVAISAGTLQKTGGSFTLSAETDFGASYGLKSLYYKSRATNVAATGAFRLANAETGVVWRNFLNNADLALTVNASNQLTFNGTPIQPNTLTSAHILVGNGSNIATDVAMTGDISIDNTGLTAIGAGKIVNAQVNASAAIAYSKLALTNSILNADVNSAAAIAYSKLNLSGSIVNADVNASAAIVYSKLSLTGGIVNADVNAAAAIAYSKLNLATSIVNADISASAAIAYSKLNLATSIVNADISASAAIAYSKLALTGSILNADINASAAIAYSKLALTGSILNADVNASAAIAYTKLNLSASIVNADVASAAAIVRSKLAASETVDVTYASGKGMFWTDSGTNTIKITAPTTITSTYALKWPIAQGGSNQYLTNDGSGNLSWTNAAGTGTVNSGTQYQLAYYATTTNAVSGLTLITASRALASDANGLPVASATTAAELAFVNGVTSAIQTQLNLKAPLASPTFTGVVTIPVGVFSSPSLIFLGDTSGLYQRGTGEVNISCTGVETLRIAPTQILNFVPVRAVNNGAVGTPQFSFNNDATTGMYLQAVGHPSITAAGTEVFRFSSTELIPFVQIGAAINGTVGAPFYSWDSDLDCGMYRIGTNDIGISTNGIIGLEVDSSQAVSIRGTSTNNNATAGFVGETVLGNQTTFTAFPTSTQWGDLTSISLTAGDWLVWGTYQMLGNGGTTTEFSIAITTTTGNSTTGFTNGLNNFQYRGPTSFTTTNDAQLTVSALRFSLTATTTVYLKYEGTYSSTAPTAAGNIRALRIR